MVYIDGEYFRDFWLAPATRDADALHLLNKHQGRDVVPSQLTLVARDDQPTASPGKEVTP